MDDFFCNDCGEPIRGESSGAEFAQRKPCPKCGSLVRRHSLTPGTGGFIVLGGSATLTVTTYPETLLSTAWNLIEAREFSIAIVVAHMACEIAVEGAISQICLEGEVCKARAGAH